MSLSRLSCFTIMTLMLTVHFSRGHAQTADTISSLAITGYVDAYYAYYTDSVGPGNLQKFPNTSARSNSFSLNTAQLSVDYNAEKIRAKTILHFGDFPLATWAPAPFNNIMEAHAGIKVFDKVWIEGGFFRAHFGTEYLLPIENLTSSVAVCTYFSPYYESGVRFSFMPVKKLDVNVYLLNGYNTFIDNNDKKSLGISAFYALWENGGVGYTNYIGDESAPADPVAHLRVHHNVSVNYQHNKLKVQAGGDYCTQQNSDIATGSKPAVFYTALATLKYQWTKKLRYRAGVSYSQIPKAG